MPILVHTGFKVLLIYSAQVYKMNDRINIIMCFYSIDASKEDGSYGRLVNDNHINPNTKIKYITVQGKPHLCLFANQDINPREEITYNYGDSEWPWRSNVSKTTILPHAHTRCKQRCVYLLHFIGVMFIT